MRGVTERRHLHMGCGEPLGEPPRPTPGEGADPGREASPGERDRHTRTAGTAGSLPPAAARAEEPE